MAFIVMDTINDSDVYCNEYKLQLLTVTFIVMNTITDSDFYCNEYNY